QRLVPPRARQARPPGASSLQAPGSRKGGARTGRNESTRQGPELAWVRRRALPRTRAGRDRSPRRGARSRWSRGAPTPPACDPPRPAPVVLAADDLDFAPVVGDEHHLLQRRDQL